MKLLFVSSRDVERTSDGGDLCTNRNYESFCTLLGKENVEVFNLRTEFMQYPYWRIEKRINYFFGFFEGLSRRVIDKVCLLATDKDSVFIDDALYGSLAWYLKKSGYNGTLISFFHNVESKISWQKWISNPLNFWELPLCKYNEKKAFQYADIRVVLNNRDRAELRELYGKKQVEVIPISLKDKQIIPVGGYTKPVPVLLFVGSYWYANKHGIEWFIDQVLDEVNIKLQIVGRGMEALKEKYDNPKIEVHGFVPDLSQMINQADFIISPIFKGSGMKVKTCEALMYGKNILGTSEAFEGYDIEAEKVGFICNTREAFIQAIKSMADNRRPKFNAYSRDVFLKKYSFQATLLDFRQLLPDFSPIQITI